MTELQNTILEMIARGESLADTLDRLCREVEALATGALCSVLAVDPAGTLKPLAGPSLPRTYSDALDGVAIGPDVGTCGAAAYFGREVTSRDVETDPHWAAFRDLVLPLGLKACWSSPIFDSGGAVIATFAFYYRECRGPSELERQIVERCVHLCSIALSRHRRVLERERRALTDALTGLRNRGAFNAALAELDCSRPGSWALCLADLDNLKVVNDTFGHQAGDILIKHVAERLTRAAPPNMVFRVGGDEFAIIVTDPDALADLDATVQRYLTAMEPVANCDGNMIRPRATIGMAVLSNGDLTVDRVRQNADFALYHAKETGRGGFVRYWPGIGTRMTRRLTAIRDVDAALREDRIKAFYQPLYRIASGEIVGLEALCRMRIGQEYVTAASFHDAMSDVHIASALTERMMEQIATDLRGWLDMGIPFQHVGINVSSGDFHNGAIYPILARTFEKEGVPLKHVILEVTESVYMDDDAGVVRKTVEALRHKGLQIALDDFGTGYASLTHLMSVPVEYLKIDKSFVDRIVTHVPSRAIVEGIAGIAAKMGIGIVAEGVESAEQARLLLSLGCGMGQGYFYSHAVDADCAGAMMMEGAEGLNHTTARAQLRLI